MPIACGAALALPAQSMVLRRDFPEEIMSAHMTPEQVRSKIDHPIVDGDGHWVEYDPVFSEKMRKVGGDLAADGFLKAMGTTREALTMSVADRRHKPSVSRPSGAARRKTRWTRRPR
jgi:hypothetical protein